MGIRYSVSYHDREVHYFCPKFELQVVLKLSTNGNLHTSDRLLRIRVRGVPS